MLKFLNSQRLSFNLYSIINHEHDNTKTEKRKKTPGQKMG